MPEWMPHSEAVAVATRVRVIEGLQRCSARQVKAVHQGQDINDPLMTAAIEREMKQYGLDLRRRQGQQRSRLEARSLLKKVNLKEVIK